MIDFEQYYLPEQAPAVLEDYLKINQGGLTLTRGGLASPSYGQNKIGWNLSPDGKLYSGQIRCSVRRITTDQVISNNTYTKVQFNADGIGSGSYQSQWNPFNEFDGTNYWFVPIEDGYFLCIANIVFQGSTTASRRVITFFVNAGSSSDVDTGRNQETQIYTDTSGNAYRLNMVGLIRLMRGSQLFVEVLQDSGAGLNVIAEPGTFLKIIKIANL